MSLPDTISQRVADLLSESIGTPVHVIRSEPITEGWSAQHESLLWPWVTRCTIDGRHDMVPPSVVVKMCRPASAGRGGRQRFYNEWAALAFLTPIGSSIGPRLLAADVEVGILIMVDLGAGPALEDLLVGSDPVLAERGLVAFARTLGQMHAATIGHAATYYQIRSKWGSVDPAFDRISILGIGIELACHQLLEIAAERSYLPHPDGTGINQDLAELLQTLSDPGPYLAFSNGDTSPTNCRISESGLRFMDFEHAAFRHVLVDAAALRFPFPACGCWSHLPEDVGHRVEGAYRTELARSCPDALDEAIYAYGMTVACMAWTIVRAVRLPKLENADAPHWLGFSRRGQLLDTIDTTLSCARQSRRLANLAAWLTDIREALLMHWPDVRSPQPFYPAFLRRSYTQQRTNNRQPSCRAF